MYSSTGEWIWFWYKRRCSDWLLACDLTNEDTICTPSFLGRLLRSFLLLSVAWDRLNHHMTLYLIFTCSSSYSSLSSSQLSATLISTSICGVPALLDVRLTLSRILRLSLSHLIYCGGMWLDERLLDLILEACSIWYGGVLPISSRDFTGYFAHESLALWNWDVLLAWRMSSQAYLPPLHHVYTNQAPRYQTRDEMQPFPSTVPYFRPLNSDPIRTENQIVNSTYTCKSIPPSPQCLLTISSQTSIRAPIMCSGSSSIWSTFISLYYRTSSLMDFFAVCPGNMMLFVWTEIWRDLWRMRDWSPISDL